MIRRCGLLMASAILLGACAGVSEKTDQEYQLADMQRFQKQKDWSLEGRLALVNEKDSISASIVWRHAETRDDIELSGPLAQGRMKISVKAEEVVVDDGEKVSVYRGEADEVVAELLGVEMPVTALRFWVLGVNDPGLSFVAQPNGFYQSGWLVRYGEMQTSNTYKLPKKITAEKDRARLKLIVDEWNLL